MIETATTDPPMDVADLLQLTADLVAEAAAAGRLPTASPMDYLAGEIAAEPTALHAFIQACCFAAPYGQSWVHAAGTDHPYLSLQLAAASLTEEQYRELLAAVVLADSPAVPYDYRALAAAELGRVGPGEFASDLRAAVAAHKPVQARSWAQKAALQTDGIDHLFPIPDSTPGRLATLRAASRRKTMETCGRFAERVLAGPAAAPTADWARPTFASAEAAALIRADVAAAYVRPEDYLVRWDEVLGPASTESAGLTLAEILRMILLCPEFRLPDATIRPAVVDFYRAVLKISGRSIIGLSAGVFHVEHGTAETPSYFYLGRGAVLGKGCVIDCVGGAVLGHESFLGGGFMPILVHSHKHLKDENASAASERKRILPCIVAAAAGARLPMSAVGLFEAADYLDGTPSPYPGIYAIPLTSGEVTR
jgi:hypothetical protein